MPTQATPYLVAMLLVGSLWLGGTSAHGGDHEACDIDPAADGCTNSNEGSFNDACRSRLMEASDDAMAVVEDAKSQVRDFSDDLEAALQRLESSHPSPDEMEAFHSEWSETGEALFHSIYEAMAAQLGERLGDCMPDPQELREMLMHEASRRGSDDGRWADVEAIRNTCEAQAHDILDGAYAEPPADDSWEDEGPEDASMWEDDASEPDDAWDEESDAGDDMGGEAEAGTDDWQEDEEAVWPGDYSGVHEDDSSDAREDDMDPWAYLPEDVAEELRSLWEDCAERMKDAAQQQSEDQTHSIGTFTMTFDVEVGLIHVRGDFLTMEGIPAENAMQAIACAGAPIAERLDFGASPETFRPQQSDEGSAILVYDGNDDEVLGVYDAASCTINMAASELMPYIHLDLEDYLHCEQAASGDVACQGGDGAVVARVLLTDGEIQVGAGNDLYVYGKASLLVNDADAPLAGLGAAYDEALASNHMGGHMVASLEDGEATAAAAPIGDVDIEVSASNGEDGPSVTAVLDSATPDGKTFYIELSDELFASDDFDVELVAIDEDGQETPMEMHEATDIYDVLNPFDDGDAGEYLVVTLDGQKGMFTSVPHFSTKRLQIRPASAGSDDAGSSIPGFSGALMLASLGLAAMAAGVRRRFL